MWEKSLHWVVSPRVPYYISQPAFQPQTETILTHKPAFRRIRLTTLALGSFLYGCSSVGSAPEEPLAEAIPITPGVILTGSWAEKHQANQIQTAGITGSQNQLSAFERQSQELDRRIKALRRQSRELERLKKEIKAIIESAPQAP
jgi:hypothetical protein